MNENIDLTKILKNCPEGWEFYSSIAGRVRFIKLDLEYPETTITVQAGVGRTKIYYTKKGLLFKDYSDAECTLFPSKDQRDWSKFTAPWYKKEKFDPKTLQPFDKVLASDLEEIGCWVCGLFSNHEESGCIYPCRCVGSSYRVCIPYNDETKHLVGTTDEAPDYYKYWEE